MSNQNAKHTIFHVREMHEVQLATTVAHLLPSLATKGRRAAGMEWDTARNDRTVDADLEVRQGRGHPGKYTEPIRARRGSYKPGQGMGVSGGIAKVHTAGHARKPPPQLMAARIDCAICRVTNALCEEHR